MRALYLKELKDNRASNTITISGDQAHHLNKVVRVKVGEKVLLLDGEGLVVEADIESLDKKDVKLKILKSDFVEPNEPRFDLAFCIPKEECM